ncbi:MAG: hypothetical protein LUC37_03895 [Prevotella sp.]|nr:hypothetical protein [Prevotella sp.]
MNSNIKFFINEEKKVIVAVAGYNGKYIRGIAKCCPEDNFDIDLGKSLAAARVNLKIEREKAKNAEEILSVTTRTLSQTMDNFKNAEENLSKNAKILSQAIDNFKEAEEKLSKTTKTLSQTMDNVRNANQNVKATKTLYQNAEKKLKAIEDHALLYTF